MKNSELKSLARQQLKGRWVKMVLYFFVYLAVITIPSIVIGFNSESSNSNAELTFNILSIIISGPISLGISCFCLNFIKNEEKLMDILWGFKKFGKAFVAYILMAIAITIGFILLIVPGIIVSLMYSQVYYILAENEDMSAIEAIKESTRIMKGNKFRLFKLGLSFIGWFILGVITLGIGFLWITPYYTITLTNFYKEISAPEY
ncbi:DUF975 family protein [Romboutsia sp.]|uniref:DUF975 family protein n=1 Tax=Romboutsia sp. TaxID=1965302 RepID=UPI002BB5C5D2|nr:DUF975 family protein [Romboutsia sp.]HSQ89711.1 DUF975 family protein [Romboutsia sp.]